MITGKHIRLRAITKGDLAQFVIWMNDPDVFRNTSMFAPLSPEQEEQWYQDTLTHRVEEQPLAIEVKTDGGWKLVGDVGLMNLDQRIRSAEIGIFIGDKSCWDKGYGTEALQMILDFGFGSVNLNRIYLRVFETNPRGIHCYEKVGFQHEGRMRQAYYLDGKYIDVLLMSILKSEWMEQK
ncbi:GNAT family N-acetyltransferase [Pelolinea submarina]|uniref:RimJ/RimL family protein N-acetyltransferase n=1 Tax=Pelolinea submarina TaxID=913107 RepID=A0A3E0A2W4_9CHLR|nr:GNAT family protein [Pelolinea submarina]REG04689.1 RimJ/RimL family protein N-acetyltransferase [Pelolinea submarina]